MKQIDFSKFNVKKIIEPFCGSCAFSVYYYDNYSKKIKYVMNDNDKQLIEFYNDVKKMAQTNIMNFVKVI